MATENINITFFSHTWRCACALIALSILIYLPILGNDFVLDDHNIIEQNESIRDFSNISSFFTTDIWSFYYKEDYHSHFHYWRPLLLISWAVTYKLSGLNPWGFHLLSILLHALCTLLVFVAGRELLKQNQVATAAAAIFALHPVHIDAIAWASGAADILVAVFTLATLISYHRFRDRQSCPWGIAAIVFFISTLFSKENGIMVPLLLVFYELLLGSDKKKIQSYFFLSGLFVLALVYFFLRQRIMGTMETNIFDIPFTVLLNTLAVVFGQYARLLLFPVHLKSTYPPEVYESLLHPDVLTALFFLALVAVLLFFTLKNKKDFFWLLFIGIPLLPAINIIGLGTDLLSERYLYLPSVGFCFLLAGFFFEKLPRLLSFFTPGRINLLLVILLCLYGVRDIVRFPDWRDDFTYLTVALRDAPGAHIHHNNMGTFLLSKRQDLKGAEKSFLTAVQLAPDFVEPRANLTSLYLEKGELKKAYQYAQQVLVLRPNWIMPMIWSAEAAGRMGQTHEAKEFLLKALSLEPNNPKIHKDLGNVVFLMNEFSNAVQYWKKAADLDPSDPSLLFNLGLGYEKLGQIEKSMQYYKKFTENAPDNLNSVKQKAIRKLKEFETR